VSYRGRKSDVKDRDEVAVKRDLIYRALGALAAVFEEDEQAFLTEPLLRDLARLHSSFSRAVRVRLDYKWSDALRVVLYARTGNVCKAPIARVQRLEDACAESGVDVVAERRNAAH
jgi:hypothetical protein